MSKPDYLLCDGCGTKISEKSTLGLPYGRECGPAGSMETLYIDGDYCNICLIKLIKYIDHQSSGYTIGELYKGWHEKNIKTRRNN